MGSDQHCLVSRKNEITRIGKLLKFTGYWVSVEHDKATLVRTTFDETDLDPATNWKQAWQNQDTTALTKGFVELTAALFYAAQTLASASGLSLSQTEVDVASKFDPEWIDDHCEIQSLSELLGAG
jgi:hypothetical protein